MPIYGAGLHHILQIVKIVERTGKRLVLEVTMHGYIGERKPKKEILFVVPVYIVIYPFFGFWVGKVY